MSRWLNSVGVRLSVLMAIAMLAGCLQPATLLGAEPVSIPAAQEGAGLKVSVKAINVSVRGTSVIFDGQPNGGDVSVPGNTTALIAEAQWSCPVGPCGMHLVMIKPRDGGSESVEGGSRARLVVQDLRAGTWNAQVRPVSVVDAVGQIRVSIFSGGAAPSDYIAFDQA